VIACRGADLDGGEVAADGAPFAEPIAQDLGAADLVVPACAWQPAPAGVVVEVDVEYLVAEQVPVLFGQALAVSCGPLTESYLTAPGMTARAWTIPRAAMTTGSPVPGISGLPSERSMTTTVRSRDP
jgi:hypothetical protein